MGICTPLYLKVSSKIGMAKCYLLANILRIISSYMLLYNNVTNIIVFILVMSIPGALTNPMTDAFSNKYVESKHRGKFNSINNISIILGQALASMTLTFGIITDNNLVLQDFISFSTVIIISLLTQLITVITVGKLTDKNIRNTNNIVTFFKIVITSIYLFLKNPFIISINKTINDNFEKAYETSVQSSIQNIIKNTDENDEVLAAVGQMCLCFTEIIVFFVLGVVSIFINENVFYIIFILSIISTIMINNIIKNNEIKKKK